MSANRFNALRSLTVKSVEEDAEIGEETLHETLNDLNYDRHMMQAQSALSAEAPVFVPRADSTRISPRRPVNHNKSADHQLQREFAGNHSPGQNWTVVKPKSSPASFNLNFSPGHVRPNFLSNENHEEKSSVRSSSSRKKALEGILARRKVLILARGPPGSGKSYMAKNLVTPNGIICNTDEYFMKDDNVYQFNPERLDDAHRWNQQRAIRAMENRVTPVIIDNTNCQAWEMAPYVHSGIRNGYEIHFVKADTPWAFDAKECARLNKHGVPYDRVVKIIDKFDHNVTLRSFTHGNCMRPPKFVPPAVGLSSTETLAEDKIVAVDQGVVGPSQGIETCTKLNDLNAWDVGDSQAWSVQSDSIVNGVKPEPKTTVSLINSLTTPKKQRSTNKTHANQKISLNSASFLTDSWGLPKDLTGGLLSTTIPVDAQGVQLSTAGPVDDRQVQICDKQLQVSDKLIQLSTCLRRGLPSTDGGDSPDVVQMKKMFKNQSPTNQKLSCDKGTQADLGPPVSDDDRTPFDVLKCCFPAVPVEDLSHILDTCDGDIEWATNVLLDTGHEINWTLISEATGGSLNSTKTAELSDLDEDFYTRNETAGETNDDIQVQSTLADDLESCHLLELSVDMAAQLQQMFGRLHDDLPAELLSPQQMKIRLPFGLVAQLYQYWLNTQTCESVSSILSDDDVDEVYCFDDFIPLDELSDASGLSSTSSNIQRQLQLDEQLARQLLEEEQQNYFAIESSKPSGGDPSSLSTKLKLKKLIEMFPSVDHIVLNELFKANNYMIEPTIDVICSSFSLPANRKPKSSTVLTPSTSKRPQPQIQREDHADDLNYEQLRCEALEHFQKRKEYFQKAQDAYRRGMKTVASYYAQVGRVHDTKFKEANRLAAQNLLEFRKSHDPLDTLDLHGLHVPEAIAALAEKLKDYEKRPGKCLKVITGQGKHSDKGPRIKPAVISFLTQRKYCFTEIGSGLIQIQIK